MTQKISVTLGGTPISGWTKASVTAGIERTPRTFELEIVTAGQGYREPISADNAPKIPYAMPILISLYDAHNRETADSQPVLSGYIDKISNRLDGGQHEVIYAGRGACSDLIDCSSEYFKNAQNQLGNIPIIDAIRKIAATYNVEVEYTDPIVKNVFNAQLPFSIGDTCYSAIEYFARWVGCIVYETAAGTLMLAKANSEQASQTLLDHKRCIASSYDIDTSAVYSSYDIYAQFAANNSGEGVAGSEPTGRATSDVFKFRKTPNGQPRIRKFRKVLDLALNPLIYDKSNCGQQVYADWLANRLRGRAEIVQVAVQGWYDDAGQLWTPNSTVNVSLPMQNFIGIDNKPVPMLITECTYSVSPDAGTITTLTLMRKEAFYAEPISMPLNADVVNLAQSAVKAPPNTGGNLGHV